MSASIWNPVVPEIIVDPALRVDLLSDSGATNVVTKLPAVGAVALNLQKYIQAGRYNAWGFIDPARHSAIRAGTSLITYELILQKWLDAMANDGYGGILPNGTYLMGYVNYYNDDGSLSGITSLKLHDKTDIIGESHAAVLKVIDNMYGPGAYYRILSSRDTTRLRNASLSNFTLDGNKQNNVASIQCNNILLEVADEVSLSRIISKNCNGNSIMLRGAVGGVATNIDVDHCKVLGASTVGIQLSHVVAGKVTHNQITDTGDNCIDVYGEDYTTDADNASLIIAGNTAFNSAICGVFVETSSYTNVYGNVASNCLYGINVNRVNGQPRAVNIFGNITRACQYGFRGTGDTGGVSIKNNVFDGYSIAGVQLGAGIVGNTSYYDISDNTFVPASNVVPTISLQGAVASFNTGRNNTVISAGITPSYLLVNTAVDSFGTDIGGFKVLPFQVGPDLYGKIGKVGEIINERATFNNLGSTGNIAVSDNTSGEVIVTAFNAAVGRSIRTIKYIRSGGILTLGTQTVDAVVTATPTNAATVGSGVNANTIQLNFVAATGNNVAWGFRYLTQP